MTLVLNISKSKINIDFTLGSFATKITHRLEDITVLQRYYPEGCYRYDSKYSPGPNVSPYTNCIIYLKKGDSLNKWKKLRKAKTFYKGIEKTSPLYTMPQLLYLCSINQR